MLCDSMLEVMHLLAAEPAKPVDQKVHSNTIHLQLVQGKVGVDSRCYH